MKKILFAVVLGLVSVAASASVDSGTRFLSELADKAVLTMNNHRVTQVDSSGCTVTFYWGEKSWLELDFSDVAAIELHTGSINITGPTNGHHNVPYLDDNSNTVNESKRFSGSRIQLTSSVDSFIPDIERAVRSMAADCGAHIPHFTE